MPAGAGWVACRRQPEGRHERERRRQSIDLSYSKDDTTCYLTLHCRGCDYEGVSWNLFDALCKARLQLEPQGLIPVCYGASENVYPSGMCLDMGSGSRAYLWGKKGPLSLVDIFATGPEVIPSTVADQSDSFAKK